MQVKNVREYALNIDAGRVEPGGSIEVDDELGASLLEQPDNWAPGGGGGRGKGAKAQTDDDGAAETQPEED